MNTIFDRIKELVRNRDVRISEHGYDELTQDDITVQDIFESFKDATLIESYPEYPKGPCILLLQEDRRGEPIHVVWGISRGASSPAFLLQHTDRIQVYGPRILQGENDA